ncbi:hypothetical protein V494_08189 [Pseudogymnoascus sp. VKM F-4513 (FW-928)]|nr:hypothetical protein V494_08189 [Pseudogymnoascus sp. VKM F-4513 (FW-928)]
MSADVVQRIERDLYNLREELWNIDSPDDVLSGVLEMVLRLKAQLEVQRSLQATANLLRRQPSDKALPKQQATKVKHLIRFAFRQNSRQELHERSEEAKERKEARRRNLRRLDCDAVKLCGLSYTTEEIIRLGDVEFGILQKCLAEFISYRNLSHLLYRPDVDKAVDSKLEDPDDDGSYDKFMQSHTARRLSTRKRKYDAIASPNEAAQAPMEEKVDTNLSNDDKTEPSQASAKTKTNTYDGDAFISKYNANDENKRSFLTLWVSEAMGKELGKRSKPMVLI